MDEKIVIAYFAGCLNGLINGLSAPEISEPLRDNESPTLAEALRSWEVVSVELQRAGIDNNRIVDFVSAIVSKAVVDTVAFCLAQPKP